MSHNFGPLVLVTVTYGDRWPLLRKSLNVNIRQGVNHCIVVDNGASDDIKALAAEEFPNSVEVITFEENIGSAAAFSAGIKAAIQSNSKYVLLMDDDNAFREGALSKLVNVLRDLILREGLLCLVCGYRPGHLDELLRRSLTRQEVRLVGSFAGFNLFDLPMKLHWRLRGRALANKVRLPDVVPIRWAPYGGMLFRKELISYIGLPDPKFVLYQDDIDFSYRVTAAGGTLCAVPMAMIDDIETSWNAVRRSQDSSGRRWFVDADDFRIFYSFRNLVYWCRHGCNPNLLFFHLNAVIYMAYLGACALWWRKFRRYKLLMLAAWDGYAAQMGLHPGFALLSGGKQNRECRVTIRTSYAFSAVKSDNENLEASNEP